MSQFKSERKGLARGLSVEKIVGMTKQLEEIHFIIKVGFLTVLTFFIKLCLVEKPSRACSST